VLAGIVEADGSLSHVQGVRASSEAAELAIERVADQFTFKPGELDGRPVRTRVVFPVLVDD
jgi:hypothetical protein